MDINEQIDAFKDFFDDNYKTELYTAVMAGKKSLAIDFSKLAKHNPDLAELLIENPEDLVKAAELAIEHFDLPKPTKHFRIRFFNLPVSQRLRIGDIRSEHLGIFIWVESIVRQSSDIRPQVTNAKFECAGCGNTISILQIDTKFKEPSRCSCGWRGKFRLLSKDLVDVQHLKVEEAPESLEGGEQPKRLSIFLKEDLVEAKMEKRTAPGAKILVFGIVKEVPIPLKTGAQSTRYDLIMEANNVVPVQEDYSDISLNDKDVQEIIEFSKDPKIYEKFTKAIAPSIYGHEKIKQALVLQLMGGVRKVKRDKTVIRGDIHILLVGDPGSGKSAILSFIAKAAPKARFVSGKGSTGAGLTAAVVKDEFLKGWSLEAGALVLANKGIACLHPNTKVVINKRVVDIEKIYNKNIEERFYSNGEEVFVNNIKEKVPSFDLEKMNVCTGDSTAIRRKMYKGDLTEISFKSGFSLMLTPKHKLIDGSSLEWKEAANFKIGESVVAPSREQMFKFIDRVGEFMNKEDIDLATNLIKKDFFLDEVVAVRRIPYEGYVYDLFVPKTHSFVANGIIVHNCVDELDKMTDDDRSALHEALEQQIISISKANIQATLRAETTMLAAANPKLGRFDPYAPIAGQIDMPPTLLNRFDLIFPIRDIPNKEKDEKIALHVLEEIHKEETYSTEIAPGFLKKYLAYVKMHVHPKMTKSAINEIKDFYVTLRNSGRESEEGAKPIPISARQLEALIRLSEASARIRLDDKVSREDARRAIELLKHCLMQVGFDPETGQIDIDRITSGITASARNRIFVVKEIIDDLTKGGVKQIPIDEIINHAVSKGIEDNKVEDTIEQLRRSGEVFEPRKGFIQKI